MADLTDHAPEGAPNIDRLLDGFWGVSDLVTDFRNLVDEAARQAETGGNRRVRVWVEQE